MTAATQTASSQTHRFRSALVVGATGGIGAAIADRLEADGARVVRISRREDGLALADEASIRRAADKLAQEGCIFDLIFLATGTLEAAGQRPEKAFSELEPDAMAEAFAVNAIGPAFCFKHFAALLCDDRPSVFTALSARVGSIGDNRLGGWMSYRASKAALNQIVRCAAIEIRRKRPQAAVIALHPGTIETPLTQRYAKGRYTATPAEAAGQMLTVLSGVTPDQSGSFLDYAGKEIAW